MVPILSEHGLILRAPKNKLTVSCECRAVLGKHSRNPPGEYYEPMQWDSETVKYKEVYNDPKNHYAPFTEQDKI